MNMVKNSQSKKDVNEKLKISLLDSNFNLANLSSIKSKLTHNTGFLVIGVIGKKGVGKSFLLNQLAGKNLPFPLETVNELVNQTYCTSGIDMHITDDRVILLDCMPLLCLDQLSVSFEREKKLKVFSSDEIEHDSKFKMTFSPDIIAVQLISFMLSVCHVLLIADQNVINYRLLKIIDLAHRLRPWIPCNPAHLPLDEPRSNNVHSSFHDEFHDYVAQMIFVENMRVVSRKLGPIHLQDNNIPSDKQYVKCITNILQSYRLKVEEQFMLREWLKDLHTKWRKKYENKMKRKVQKQKDNKDNSRVIQLDNQDIGDDDNEDNADANNFSQKSADNILNTDKHNDDKLELSDEDNNNVEEEFQSKRQTKSARRLFNEYLDKKQIDMAIEQRLHLTIDRPIKYIWFPLIDEEIRSNHSQIVAFRDQILGCPRKHFSATQNERFSEFCWLEHCCDMWHLISEGQTIPDYYFKLTSSFSLDY